MVRYCRSTLTARTIGKPDTENLAVHMRCARLSGSMRSISSRKNGGVRRESSVSSRILQHRKVLRRNRRDRPVIRAKSGRKGKEAAALLCRDFRYSEIIEASEKRTLYVKGTNCTIALGLLQKRMLAVPDLDRLPVMLSSKLRGSALL